MNVEDTDEGQALGLEAPAMEEKKKKTSHLLKAAGVGIEKRRKNSANMNQIRMEDNQMVLETPDGQKTQVEIIDVIEKQGNFRKAVPALPVPLAIIFCIFNVCLPGLGTLLGALCVLCCGTTKHDTKERGVKYGVGAAFLQIITTPLIFGWIWSIKYGVCMVQDSLSESMQKRNDEKSLEPKITKV